MKKLSLFLLSLFFVQAMQAQDQKEGYIRYSEIIKMDLSQMKGLENLPEEIRSKIPDEHKMIHILYFNEKEMLFSNYVEEEKDQNVNYNDPDNNMQIEMNIDAPDYKLHTNLSNNKFVESQELFGRRFLIKGEYDKKEWKMTTEIKTILGYPCQKATTKGEKGLIEVWYTIAIPAKIGPPEFHQLPGAVLEVNIKEEGRQISATEIQFEKLAAGTIAVPQKGKKVSKEEFKKILEEKNKEMQKMYGGNRMMIIESDDR